MKLFGNLTARNALIGAYDASATGVALLTSFYLRFDGDPLLDRLPLLYSLLPYFMIFSMAVCYVFKLNTTKWRFISLPDALNILQVSTILSLALVVLDYIFVAPNIQGTFVFGKITIIYFWFLETFFLSVARMLYRYFRYTRVRRHARADNAALALLVGSLADAEILLRGIESGATKHIWPVGLLSPSTGDRGLLVRGVPVLGGIDDIEDVVMDFRRQFKPISRVVMTPSAFDPGVRPELVLTRARQLGLIVNRVPSLERADAPRLAPVAIEDLLLRPTARIDFARLEALVRGKAIIVTGGGGSIGAEICDRVVSYGASRILIIESSEPALYAVTEKLVGLGAEVVIDGRIADVRDRDRMLRLMNEFKPDIVFHAAALKHVPILERDWSEGVKTNIFGSINVADAALLSGAEAMVMISTDKAVEPVSMLGLTKRFAEMYCQALDRDLAASGGQMRLISVRFGNVLASNGSVVPKFRRQIESGGPVTVTHPEMVRYFMTIREACDLVITASAHAASRDHSEVSIYVLDMGQAVKIVELAERMIRLSGLEPGHDIDIVFTGMRPGERLEEILFTHQEKLTEIGIAGITAAKPNESSLAAMKAWIAALKDVDDLTIVRAVLAAAVPESISNSVSLGAIAAQR
jgi:FlaA1/EpsC-like NDP-sugar epimerase